MALVYSGDSFKAETLGREGLRYTENGRSAVFDGEMLVGECSFVVYSASCYWEDSGVALTPAEARRATANISKAFKLSGSKVAIE